MKGFSQEELRQREKEERSRAKLQEQAYREAQRGVYTRIYEEQNAMPDDAKEAFRDAPKKKKTLSGVRKGSMEDTISRKDLEGSKNREKTKYKSKDNQKNQDNYRKEPVPAQKSSRKGNGKGPNEPPTDGGRGKGKKKKVLITILLVLLALVIAGVAVHAIYVKAPELPSASTTDETDDGTDPGALGTDRKEDVYTFLLVGRDDGGGGNTDTIMVGTFDVKNGTLSVLSIYRDTLVDVPWEIKKINSVYNREGIEGLLEEVKDLIGFAPDYYFVVELSAVTELVDALGGVDYEVPYNMDYDDPTQDLSIHFTAGMQHLDGEDAVRLLRWRKNNSGESLSVGDIGRVEIQHSFLQAMASQAVSLGNVTKIKKIASIVDKKLTSNLSYGEMIWFGEKALGLNKDSIQFLSLPGDYTGTIWSSTYQNYQSYVFVNDAELLNLVNEYLNPYTTDITSDMQHVIYGTTVNNQVTLPESTGEQISTASSVSDASADSPTGGNTPTEKPATTTTTTSKPAESQSTNSGTTTTNNSTTGNTTTNNSQAATTTPAETTKPAETETPAEPTPSEPEQTPSESQAPSEPAEESVPESQSSIPQEQSDLTATTPAVEAEVTEDAGEWME